MSKRLYCLALLAGVLACSTPSLPGSTHASPNVTEGAGGLFEDAGIFDAVRSVMDSAAARVWVEMYEFGRQDLADALAAARSQNLDVRLLYDPSVAVSRTTASQLQARGIAVRAYPLDDRRHQIDHVKLLLTESGAVVGGMNWGRHSAANHDYAMELHDPALQRGLTSMFEEDWALAGGAAPTGAAGSGLVAAASDGSVTATETTPGQGILSTLLGALRGARQSISAEVFVLTDGEVLTSLAAAARRGVRVRVLLDPNQDVNQASRRTLEQSGVPVRWYPVAPGAKLHAKAGLFDRRLLVGSANWSLSGLTVNHELDLMIDRPAVAETFAAQFEADWDRSG